MHQLPTNKLGFFGTIKHSILLWISLFISVLPFSIVAGVASSWPIYLKKHVQPDQNFGLFITLSILITVISLIPYLSIIGKFARATMNQATSFSQSLAIGLTKLPAALGLLIMTLVILGIPVLAGIFLFTKYAMLWLLIILILLFFILSVYLNISFPILVVEGINPFKAIKRSFKLVHHHFWYVASLVFLFSLFTVAIENLGRNLFQDIGFIVAFCIMLPLQIAVSVVIMQELKKDESSEK